MTDFLSLCVCVRVTCVCVCVSVRPNVCSVVVLARVVRCDPGTDGSFTLTLSVPELERALGKKFKPRTK